MMNSNSTLSLTSVGVCFDIIIFYSVIHLLWQYFNMQWIVCSLRFKKSLFDILITDVSEEEHLHNLQIVLQQLDRIWKVCRILVTSVLYLGHKLYAQMLHLILNSCSQLPYYKSSNLVESISSHHELLLISYIPQFASPLSNVE